MSSPSVFTDPSLILRQGRAGLRVAAERGGWGHDGIHREPAGPEAGHPGQLAGLAGEPRERGAGCARMPLRSGAPDVSLRENTYLTDKIERARYDQYAFRSAEQCLERLVGRFKYLDGLIAGFIRPRCYLKHGT
jgi:hypothetical protein